jgi:hypothetical protein
MRYAVLSLCLLVGAVVSVKAADPPAKDEALDKSVGQALAFLQSTQLADGAWGAGLPANGGANPAVTSLSVMAFLSAGHVPGEGRYGEAIEKGIRWVLQNQQENGLIAGNGGQEMYHHGISTLMLAEAAGMTDGKLGEEIRKKLVKAVALILKAQRTEDGPERGGWRYTVAHQGGSDISVTGWQIMALRAAKNVGCDVPADNIDRAVEFIKRCQDPRTGGFCYQPGSNLTVPCTGTSILALEICGKNLHHSPEVLRAGAYLLKNPPRWGQQFGFYGIYYCSQATFQLGDNYWEFFRPLLHDMAYKNQKENGSWIGGGDGSYGPNYSTAMCVLALTVEYRYLPIYQRGEEPTDKK